MERTKWYKRGEITIIWYTSTSACYLKLPFLIMLQVSLWIFDQLWHTYVSLIVNWLWTRHLLCDRRPNACPSLGLFRGRQLIWMNDKCWRGNSTNSGTLALFCTLLLQKKWACVTRFGVCGRLLRAFARGLCVWHICSVPDRRGSVGGWWERSLGNSAFPGTAAALCRWGPRHISGEGRAEMLNGGGGFLKKDAWKDAQEVV